MEWNWMNGVFLSTVLPIKNKLNLFFRQTNYWYSELSSRKGKILIKWSRFDLSKFGSPNWALIFDQSTGLMLPNNLLGALRFNCKHHMRTFIICSDERSVVTVGKNIWSTTFRGQTVHFVRCKRISRQGRSLCSSFVLSFSLIVPTKLSHV